MSAIATIKKGRVMIMLRYCILTLCMLPLANYCMIYINNNVSQKFAYITVLHNEKNAQRAQEYITCLEKNFNHPSIANIHVIYDTSFDNRAKNSTILDYLKSKKILTTHVKGRPTFGFCFALAHKFYPNKAIILSNADIYFNDTLKILEHVDLAHRFFALTCWQVLESGLAVPCINPKTKRINLYSQDTWIYQDPLPKLEKDDYQMGAIAYDNYVAYYAKRAGLEVANPCRTIQCCHLHLACTDSQANTNSPIVPKDYTPPSWSAIFIDAIQ